MNPAVKKETRNPVGRPEEHTDHPIAKIIKEYFDGDREAAAAAWQYSKSTISQIICGSASISPRLAKRISISTGNKIAWKDLL